MKSLVTVTLISTACVFAAEAKALDVRGLGSLSGGSYAKGLNEQGQVVGYYGNYQSFIWDETNGMRDLVGPNEGKRINDSGQVAGTIGTTNGLRAFAWDPPASWTYCPDDWSESPTNGTLHNIGTLGQAESESYDINQAGQVVGGSYHDHRALLWDSSSGITDLSPIVGLNTVAGAINDVGQVAGNTRYSDAWILDLTTNTVTPIDGSGIGFNDNMRCWAINNSGQVVGVHGSHGDADAEAFYYDDSSLYNLGGLPDALTFGTRAYDINDAGMIVGEAKTKHGIYHAVISDNGGAWTDMNDLLSPDSGWTLHSATDINNSGVIVGWGTNPSGQIEAWITSIPTDFNRDFKVNLADMNLLTAQANLPVGLPVQLVDPKFDLNDDGMINGDDLDKWLEDAARFNGHDSPYLKGDANLDCDVDVFAIDGSGDAQILSSNLGTTSGAVWGYGDFNGDGDVDVWEFAGLGDAQTLAANLGRSNSDVGHDAAAGTAEVLYDPATGELFFDVGEGIAVIGIGGTTIDHGAVDTGSIFGAPAQNEADILAYFNAAGLPVGEDSVGLVLPAGLDPGDFVFSYTPIGGDSTPVPVTIVPEPGTFALLGMLGLIGVIWRRRGA